MILLFSSVGGKVCNGKSRGCLWPGLTTDSCGASKLLVLWHRIVQYLYATSNKYYYILPAIPASIIHSLHPILVYYYLVLFPRRWYVGNKAGAEAKRSIQPGRAPNKPGFGHEGLSEWRFIANLRQITKKNSYFNVLAAGEKNYRRQCGSVLVHCCTVLYRYRDLCEYNTVCTRVLAPALVSLLARLCCAH